MQMKSSPPQQDAVAEAWTAVFLDLGQALYHWAMLPVTRFFHSTIEFQCKRLCYVPQLSSPRLSGVASKKSKTKNNTNKKAISILLPHYLQTLKSSPFCLLWWMPSPVHSLQVPSYMLCPRNWKYTGTETRQNFLLVPTMAKIFEELLTPTLNGIAVSAWHVYSTPVVLHAG